MATATATRIRGREREVIAQELRRRVSGEVRFDAFSRVLYSTDASIYQMETIDKLSNAVFQRCEQVQTHSGQHGKGCINGV